MIWDGMGWDGGGLDKVGWDWIGWDGMRCGAERALFWSDQR